jgi:pimeloyl-ACP methyl ester carboxylesterase
MLLCEALSSYTVKKRYLLPFFFMVCCLILDSCLTMRTSDRRAVKTFHKAGVTLATRTLHIRDRHLHYVSVGTDTMRTIVFVHGSPGSWDAFQSYLMDSALRSRFRMISIDRPGFGYSDFREAMNLQDDCDLISSLLDSVQNGKDLFLVGHSLGGSIVPILAADNPGKVKGIVVLAGAVDPDMEEKEAWRHAFTKIPLRYLLPGAMRPSNDELWSFKSDVIKMKAKLPLIKCRVYIVHAVNDALVPVGNVAYMKRNFINAQVSDTIFPSGNHFIPWNHTEYIKKLLGGL